jgi:hypothetical protein
LSCGVSCSLIVSFTPVFVVLEQQYVIMLRNLPVTVVRCLLDVYQCY